VYLGAKRRYINTLLFFFLSINIGRKLGALTLRGRSGAGSTSNTMLLGPRTTFGTKWHLDPSSRLATINMGRKVGVCPFLVGGGSPSSTMWPGPRPTSIPSGILINPAVWPQQTWRIIREWAPPPFGGGVLGLHLTQCRLGRGYLPTKWHLAPSSHLATTYTGRILEGLFPFDGRGAMSLSNRMWPAIGLRPTCMPIFTSMH